MSDMDGDVRSETLAVFRRSGSVPLTTREVSEALEVPPATAQARLDRLADRGEIAGKEVDEAEHVWWRVPPVVRDGEREGASTAGVDPASVRFLRTVPGLFYRTRDATDRPISFASPGCEQLTGYDPVDLVDGAVEWYEDLVVPEDRARVETTIENGLAANGRYEVEYRIETADGDQRWVRDRGARVDDARVIEGFVSDVTDRRRSERDRRTEVAFSESLLDAQQDIVYAFEPDGTMRRWNDRLGQVTGYDDAAIAEMTPVEFFPDEYADEIEAAIDRVLSTGDPVTVELPLRTVEGDRIPYEFTGAPITDEDGTITGVTGVGRDVTERRERERALQQERDLTDRLLEVAPASIVVFGADGSILRANEQAKERLGLEPEAEAYTLGDVDVYDEDGTPIPPDERPYVEVFETGEPVTDWHCQIERPGSDRRWVSINAVPITDDAEEVENVIVTSTDVTALTEQKRAVEHQRDELESQLEEVFERIDDAFLALDDEWQFTYVNERAAQYLDRTPEDLLGEVLWDEFEAVLGTPFQEQYERAMESQEPVSFEEYYPPLETWFSVSAYPSETGLSVYFRDVTDRKERERALAERERQLSTLMENVPGMVYRCRNERGWPMEFVSDACEQLTGYDPAALVAGEIEWGEDVMIEADREDVWETVQRNAAAGETFSVRYRIETDDGERRWVKDYGRGVFDDDGNLAYVEGIIEDVTERRERERQLERYERITENLPVGVYRNTPGPDGEFVEANSRVAEIFEVDSMAELFSCSVSDFYPEPEQRSEFSRTLEREGIVEDMELKRMTLEGEPIWVSVTAIRTEEDGEVYFDGIIQDITERKRRERRLEESRVRYQTLAENFPNGVVALFDETLEYTLIEGEILEDHDIDSADLVGTRIGREHIPEPEAQRWREHAKAALAGDSRSFETEWRGLVLQARMLPVRDSNGEVFAGMLVTQDVTERKRFERLLRSLHRTTRDLFRADSYDEISSTVVDAAASSLEVPGVAVYRFDQDAGVLCPHETSMQGSVFGDPVAAVPPGEGTIPGEAYGSGDSRHYEDVRDADLPWGGDAPVDVRSALVIPLEEHGVLAIGRPETGGFDERTRTLAEVLAANATAAFDRIERERELEESEQLYRTLAQNFPDGAVGVYDTDLRYSLVEGAMWEDMAPDPKDLEGRTVREYFSEGVLADIEPLFRAAVEDGESGSVVTEFAGRRLRVWTTPLRDSGGEIFAGLSWAVDITEQIERERALERQREQLRALNNLNEVVRDINRALVEQSTREEIEAAVCDHLAGSESYLFAWIGEVDPATETVTPRTTAETDGYVDEITVSVDPDSEYADGPTGRALRTGEIQTTQDVETDEQFGPWREVATAYGVRSSAAIPIVHENTVYGVLNVYADRPDAFEGRERDVIEQLGGIVGHAIAAVERKRALMSDEVVEVEFSIRDIYDFVDAPSTEGEILIDRAIPVGEQAFLVYGRVSDDAHETLRSLSEVIDHWQSVSVIESDVGQDRFEARLSEPPVLSTVASRGGEVVEAAFTEGDFFMTIRLPPSVSVRDVIASVQEAYPPAEMVTRRQVTRESMEGELERQLTEELTERQRAALEASYHAGFFEWPRESSGEDVAEALGVSSPTFHQHLRKAQQKLFDVILS